MVCSKKFLRYIFFKRTYLILLLLAILFTSCRITRNVPDDKYLLNKSTLVVDSKDIKPGDIETYLRQKPNKRIIGFRFHLRLYNTANPNKFKGVSKWLKTIGEEPVILDTFLVKQSVQNINLYLQSKGYYQSFINSSVTYPKKKKANVTYSIMLGEPYKIKNFHYSIEDSTISFLVRKDSLNSLIKKRKPLDSDVLQEERSRIQAYLQNCGYYFFSKDNINFDADTSIGKHKVDLQLNIKNRFIINEFGEKFPVNYLKYKINKVSFYPNYDPRNLVKSNPSIKIDTTVYNGLDFIYTGDPGIVLKVLDQSNQIRPGSIYSDDIVQRTQNNLNSLKLFRMVNIFFAEEVIDKSKKTNSDNFLLFDEANKKDSMPTGSLNCFIQLSNHTLQSYQAEFVGTNTSGAFGTEGNLSYQHKNLFRGAEIFDVKLRGLVETVQKNQSSGNLNFKYSIELGGSVGLSLPKFLSPFASKEFIKKYSPRTQIATSYNFQRRPDYTRTIASLLFGYVWKNSKFITHTVNPVEISAINITNISTLFKTQISGKYLENSYKNQIITLSSYSLTLNNQNIQKNTSYTYLRFNVESSGNILAALYSKYGTISIDSTYKILNTSFSQYLRSDINITYHQLIDNNNAFVYRVFAGVGYPYGNSKALPFDKKYFSGGANGIRAWSARSLGPGSVKVDNSGFFNQTGDIKLEANIEYRYKIFWQLEGAIFFDAGNIWAFKDENENAIFKPKTFYKQIALGTGTGFRANLGFLTVRFDFGYKVYDPIIDPSVAFKPWVPFQQKFMWSDVAVNFGIGYPF